MQSPSLDIPLHVFCNVKMAYVIARRGGEGGSLCADLDVDKGLVLKPLAILAIVLLQILKSIMIRSLGCRFKAYARPTLHINCCNYSW